MHSAGFETQGTPAAVMSIVFAGAPVVNAIVSMSLHPPKGGYPLFLGSLFSGILGGLGWLFGYHVQARARCGGQTNTPPAKIAKAE